MPSVSTRRPEQGRLQPSLVGPSWSGQFAPVFPGVDIQCLSCMGPRRVWGTGIWEKPLLPGRGNGRKTVIRRQWSYMIWQMSWSPKIEWVEHGDQRVSARNARHHHFHSLSEQSVFRTAEACSRTATTKVKLFFFPAERPCHVLQGWPDQSFARNPARQMHYERP